MLNNVDKTAYAVINLAVRAVPVEIETQASSRKNSMVMKLLGRFKFLPCRLSTAQKTPSRSLKPKNKS